MKCTACGSDDTYLMESEYLNKEEEKKYHYMTTHIIHLKCRSCGRTSIIPREKLDAEEAMK